MKKNVIAFLLFSIFILITCIWVVEFKSNDKQKKECSNQNCLKSNQVDEQIILNSLNKFIVSL